METRRQQAREFMAQSQYQDAIRTFDKILESEPENQDILLSVYTCLVRDRCYIQADAIRDRMIAINGGTEPLDLIEIQAVLNFTGNIQSPREAIASPQYNFES